MIQGHKGLVLHKKLQRETNLLPIGKIQVAGVGGLSLHNAYLFHVAFVLGVPVQGQPFQGQMHLFKNEIQGSELAIENAGFDVLLGMDVIGSGSLAIEGIGTYSFSF